jgi:hypothetical protein
VADDDRVSVTALARHHLVRGSASDLRPYYASLAARPAVSELVDVLRSGEPATWASAGGADWSRALDDPRFAHRITAAMDARGTFLAPVLAEVITDLPVSALLDVGAARVPYACAVVDRHPSARAAVVERPPVDAAARSLLQARGYADRMAVAEYSVLLVRTRRPGSAGPSASWVHWPVASASRRRPPGGRR